jgi:hypothetical protein
MQDPDPEPIAPSKSDPDPEPKKIMAAFFGFPYDCVLPAGVSILSVAPLLWVWFGSPAQVHGSAFVLIVPRPVVPTPLLSLPRPVAHQNTL